MNLRSILMEPSKPVSRAFQYGMLVFILIMLAVSLLLCFTAPPARGDRYLLLVIVLMMLFNHLAYQFRWPVPATVAIRILAWGWLIFGLFYIFLTIAYSL
jgi:hypothetical protein